MKWVRRIIMFLLIIAIAASGVLAVKNIQPWRDAQDEYDEVKAEKFEGGDSEAGFTTAENQQSVAFIICIDETGSGSSGTCYAVGELDEDVQYFVTNGHVVQDAVERGYHVFVIFDLDDDFVECEVVYYKLDDDLDMAVVKLPDPVDVRSAVVIADSDEVKTGESCIAIGYPGIAIDTENDFKGDISSQNVNKGVISKVNVQVFGYNYNTLQHDAWINHGNSGGPLFDDNGFVIGMNTLGSTDSDSVNFAIASNEVTARLDELGIDYVSSKDYLKEASKEDASAEKKFEKKHESALEDAKAEVDEARNKVIVFAGAAVGCAIILLILFVVGNKKVVVVGEQDDGKKNYLICEQGLFAGQRFEITGQTLTIGRDQHSCTFVFPEDTPGISSNHCSVYFDARTKAFVLTDNGSTYGTYLSDGRKLTKGVPETLLPGSTFSLADKTNVFKVDRA